MLKKLRKRYLKNRTVFKGTLMTYDCGIEELESKSDEKLEKKVLKLFGVLLQLIVFYLPLINMIFRGKTIPGIIS
ncbi:MAG TPA: hypothetical protein DD412_08355 [Holosporales bacterium]|nr:hypothetical protein [Holosporales bacterium]